MSLFVFFVVYLYVNDSGSITSVGEERANLSAKNLRRESIFWTF